MKKSDYVHLSNKSIMAYFNVLTKINTHNLHIQIMLIFKERKKIILRIFLHFYKIFQSLKCVYIICEIVHGRLKVFNIGQAREVLYMQVESLLVWGGRGSKRMAPPIFMNRGGGLVLFAYFFLKGFLFTQTRLPLCKMLRVFPQPYKAK